MCVGVVALIIKCLACCVSRSITASVGVYCYPHYITPRNNSINIDFTTLYDNAAGTSSTVALSDSAAHYTRLLIQYRWKDSQEYVSSVTIDAPDEKKPCLIYVHTLGGYGTSYLASAEVYISGTSITWLRNGQAAINNNASSQITNTAAILITKVIGLK